MTTLPAIDSILADVHNAGGAGIGLTAATPATGDSFTVRNFPTTSKARLEVVAVQGAAPRQARITSPLLHDNVTGLTFNTGENPTTFLLPKDIGQPLVPGDNLAISLDAAATSDTTALLCIYYENLPGTAARLFSWGDISGIIKSIKPMEVDVTSNATIGQWSDTLITTTENQLHAKSDYAVLGYEATVALNAIGVKGQETANLRVCGPGPTSAFPTSDYFVRMSEKHGTPHIPVFNADNRGSFYVSVFANTTAVASKITLILAELSQPLPSGG